MFVEDNIIFKFKGQVGKDTQMSDDGYGTAIKIKYLAMFRSNFCACRRKMLNRKCNKISCNK